MDLIPTGKESIEFGATPAPGLSIMQVSEGLDKVIPQKEDSRWVGLKLPLKVVEVIEGDKDNLNKVGFYTITLKGVDGDDSERGQSFLTSLLEWAGILDELSAQFKGNVDPVSDDFIIALQARLIGKVFKVKHNVRKSRDYTNFNIVKIEGVQSKATQQAVPQQPAQIQTQNQGWQA
jgi:hypothetical protein